MADFPGTEFTYTPLTDGVPPAGDPYESAQMNLAYGELQAMSIHFGAGTAITSGGGIRLTLADGAVDIAYTGHKAVNNLAGTPEEVIAGGVGDAAVGVVFAGIVNPSSGAAQGGVSVCLNGETVEIFNDGNGNRVEFDINAGGDAVVTRAEGSLTYDIGLNFLLIM